jgi:hypothetical protein
VTRSEASYIFVFATVMFQLLGAGIYQTFATARYRYTRKTSVAVPLEPREVRHKSNVCCHSQEAQVDKSLQPATFPLALRRKKVSEYVRNLLCLESQSQVLSRDILVLLEASQEFTVRNMHGWSSFKQEQSITNKSRKNTSSKKRYW